MQLIIKIKSQSKQLIYAKNARSIALAWRNNQKNAALSLAGGTAQQEHANQLVAIIVNYVRERDSMTEDSEDFTSYGKKQLVAEFWRKDEDSGELIYASLMEQIRPILSTNLIPRRIESPPPAVLTPYIQLPIKVNNDRPTQIDLTPPATPMVDERDEIPQNYQNIPEPVNQKDKRGNARNFTQNECSMLKTRVCHLLARTGIYGDKRTIASEYDAFLKKHNAKCNQLCLLFLFEFLQIKNVDQTVVQQLTADISNFLTERWSQTFSDPEIDRAMTQTKIKGNREVLNVLFVNYSNKEIDLEWAENVFRPMFTKKQTSTINKPLKALKLLQSERNFSSAVTSSILPPSLHSDHQISVEESDIFDVMSLSNSISHDFALDISLYK